MVPKSEHLYTGSFEFQGSLGIICNLLIVDMTTAIQFNGEVCFMAVKVYNESANGMLTAKLESAESTIAEKKP